MVLKVWAACESPDRTASATCSKVALEWPVAGLCVRHSGHCFQIGEGLVAGQHQCGDQKGVTPKATAWADALHRHDDTVRVGPQGRLQSLLQPLKGQYQ
jgi:hypothetical protein